MMNIFGIFGGNSGNNIPTDYCLQIPMYLFLFIYHEGTGVGNLSRLLEAFESELFQFGDGLEVRE
jgi:hypothetical protein